MKNIIYLHGLETDMLCTKIVHAILCYNDLRNKFVEALQKNWLKIGQDAAQAPHKHHQFTKYSQCIVYMHLLR